MINSFAHIVVTMHMHTPLHDATIFVRDNINKHSLDIYHIFISYDHKHYNYLSNILQILDAFEKSRT